MGLVPHRDSRARTDALLSELRAGGWRPAAWSRFLGRAARLSWSAALARPRAAVEVTALHLLFLTAAHRHRRGRVVVSWGLAITHLGLLDDRRTLGVPNILSVTRANLPALGSGRALGGLAVVTDLADGWLARHRGQVTAFGGYADSLADAAFWLWFAARHEPSRRVRATAVAVWAAPVVAVTAMSVAHGGMADPPRPAVLRPAAALQVVLAVRALRSRRCRPGSPAAHARPHHRAHRNR
jgi:CDP-alcohol phosphatidyltransferase-like enzyme